MLVERGKSWYNMADETLEVTDVTDRMNVRQVAELAKLALNQEEEARMAEEMQGILGLARRLQQLDLTDVPPTQHILPLVNVMREDVVHPSMEKTIVLSAAPARTEDFIAVPRAVE